MSTLQISLAVAGGLVLAGVVAHSAWSSRRNEPKRAVPEPAPTGPQQPAAEPVAFDPNLDPSAERLEPSFDSGIETPIGQASDGVHSNFGNLSALTSMTAPEKKTGLDALIDVIAPIALEGPVSGEAALAAMPSTRRVGSKPFAVEGQPEGGGDWEMPAPGRRYTAFQAGVQLANRTGALNQIEYSEFVMKAQAFADAVNGEPEFPEMTEEVARARELDHFASAHDAQISFTLRAANTAWSPGYVQQSAARLGFVPGSIPGRMVLPAGHHGGAPVLGLAFDTQAAMAEDPEQTALRELTLSLDVPQVGRKERPFARMCEVALGLAAGMDGVIIDDDGNLIRVEAMDVIGGDLEQLYDTLDERDLSAGSPLSRRLFS